MSTVRGPHELEVADPFRAEREAGHPAFAVAPEPQAHESLLVEEEVRETRPEGQVVGPPALDREDAVDDGQRIGHVELLAVVLAGERRDLGGLVGHRLDPAEDGGLLALHRHHHLVGTEDDLDSEWNRQPHAESVVAERRELGPAARPAHVDEAAVAQLDLTHQALLGIEIRPRPRLQGLDGHFPGGLRRGRRRRLGLRREPVAEVDLGGPKPELPGIHAVEVGEHDHREALAREASEVGTVAAEPAAVLDQRQPPMLADRETEGVVDHRAVVEHAAGVELLDQLLAAHLGVVEVLVPEEQVLHRREHAARAHAVEGADEIPQLAVVGREVRRRAVLDDEGVVVVDVGARHPQRAEDLLLLVLAQGLAGGPMDDDCQQEIAGVAVEIPVSG